MSLWFYTLQLPVPISNNRWTPPQTLSNEPLNFEVNVAGIEAAILEMEVGQVAPFSFDDRCRSDALNLKCISPFDEDTGPPFFP